jgi:hypothetical protein
MVASSDYVFERRPFAVSECLECAHNAGDFVAPVEQPGRYRQETVRGKAVSDPHNIASHAETLVQDDHTRPRARSGRRGGIRRYWTRRSGICRVGVRHGRHCRTHCASSAHITDLFNLVVQPVSQADARRHGDLDVTVDHDGMVETRWADFVGTDFTQNALRCRVEGRFGVSVNQPGAVVKVATQA